MLASRAVAAEDCANEMMAERFTIFKFTTPLPKKQRIRKFPKCGRCCAEFFCSTPGAPSAPGVPSAAGSDAVGPGPAPWVPAPDAPPAAGSHAVGPWPAPLAAAPDASSSSAPSATGSALAAVTGLAKLAELLQQSVLTQAEFESLKARLLSGP